MEIIKEDGFRKLLKSGLSGGYLFFGDEDYMKAHSVSAARSAVCSDETFALFNDMKIDVLDYSADALLDALMPMPMMSEQKLVTVNGLNISGLKPSELDALCDVLAVLPEYDYNVLIISVPATMLDEGNLPKYPSSVLKRLGEYLTPVHFECIVGSRLVSWVGKHFEHEGVTASPDVCSYLINYSGKSMYTLANETQKLSYYVLSQGRSAVTREDILNVSVSELALDAYTFTNALLDGRAEDAVNALSIMKFRRQDPIIIMAEVSRTVCDMLTVKALIADGFSVPEIVPMLERTSEYRVKLLAAGASRRSFAKLKEALALCAEADSAVKLSGGYLPIEKLICSL